MSLRTGNTRTNETANEALSERVAAMNADSLLSACCAIGPRRCAKSACSRCSVSDCQRQRSERVAASMVGMLRAQAGVWWPKTGEEKHEERKADEIPSMSRAVVWRCPQRCSLPRSTRALHAILTHLPCYALSGCVCASAAQAKQSKKTSKIDRQRKCSSCQRKCGLGWIVAILSCCATQPWREQEQTMALIERVQAVG